MWLKYLLMGLMVGVVSVVPVWWSVVLVRGFFMWIRSEIASKW